MKESLIPQPKYTESAPQPLDKIISKTFENYFFSLPFIPHRRELGQFLNSKLANFDPNEMEDLIQRKPILNVKLISRYLKRNDFLGAYEAFWATWNPVTHKAIRSVYDALGGNDNAPIATIGAFLYSGLVHTLHPYMIPIYIILAINGRWTDIASTAMVVTGTFGALSIPVATRKIIRVKNAKNIRER